MPFFLPQALTGICVCMQGPCLNCCLVSLLCRLAEEVLGFFGFVLFSFSEKVVTFFASVTVDSNNFSSPGSRHMMARDI